MTEKYQPKTTQARISKQNLQSISIFNYYLQILFPTIFNTQSFPPKGQARMQATDRNIIYNFGCQLLAGIENLDENIILQGGKLMYFSSQCTKVRENNFVKSTTVKLPYLPIWKEVSESIDIFVVKEDGKSEQHKRNGFRSPHKFEVNGPHELRRKRSHHLISINKIEQEKQKSQDYSLYVVHYNNTASGSIQWENFIEKYSFKTEEGDEGNTSSMTYQVVFSYSAEASLFEISQSHKILQSFYQISIFNERSRFLMPEKLSSKLINLAQMAKAKNNLELQSPSFHKSHRRELSLTPEQKVIFNNIKVKAFAYFSSVNRKREINRYFLENMICRMMGNHDYKQGESWEAIKYYIDFERRMRDKYSWSSFEKYDKMNIFTYIGKDMMGRPILLNRLRNTLCSKITDFDEFFDYHMYLFEIYMQDQMEGWVDQFFVLADVSNQVADNTNLGFTKRIAMQGFKVTMGRPFKIVAFDIGYLGTALFRILKPILPNSLIECVRIIGDDRKELLEELRTNISDESIPEFLGGRNPTLETRASHEEVQEKGNTEMTTDRSMLRSVKSLKHL